MSSTGSATELKLSERALRLTQFSVDVASEAMFTTTPDGRILSVNQMACKRLEYSREELVGMSVSDTLHSQAEQMRVERRYRAQEEARKIPTKMLFPMAFMIFPAIFAVVLGPAVPQLLDFFTGF